jgi:hypothetical protein
VRTLPGVLTVGSSSFGVMGGTGMGTAVAPAGQRIATADFLNASFNSISPGYFDSTGMRMLAGRYFTAAISQNENSSVL